MGSILENYKKQLEEDRMNEDKEFTMPSFDDDIISKLNDVDKEAVAQRVKELREDPNDMENVFKKFHQEFPKLTESELDEKGDTKLDTDVKLVIKRAFCPNCGKELVSKSPVMYNPFTLEKVAKHECECGFKANLEHAYPRMMFVNSNGEEIKAFAD